MTETTTTNPERHTMTTSTDDSFETITVRNQSGQIARFSIAGEAGADRAKYLRQRIATGELELWTEDGAPS